MFDKTPAGTFDAHETPKKPSRIQVESLQKLRVYCTLSDIASDISSTPNSKVAVVFTGGGARGAYEAGVAEAILQRQIKPDIIVGTSAGAIVALSLFMDTMYPHNTVGQPYIGRQSALWRQICDGNAGASQLVDKAWLVQLINKEPTTLVTDIQNLQNDLQSVKNAISSLKNDLSSLINDANNPDGISKLSSDINNSLQAISTDVSNLQKDVDPDDHSRHYSQVPGDIVQLAEDTVDGVGTAMWDLGNTLVQTVQQIMIDIGRLSSDFVQFMGSVEHGGFDLISTLDVLSELLGKILPILHDIFSGADHIIDNTLLKSKIRGLMFDSFQQYHSGVTSNTLDSAIILDWNTTNDSGTLKPAGWLPFSIPVHVPELVMTGTNLTASRQILFAIAKKDTLRSLSDSDRWTVDLTRTLGSTINNTFVTTDAGKESILDSCITSTSIPVAFIPQRWNISGMVNGSIHNLSHICVDGGVLDNTPLDIAMASNPTHILCIQLDPYTNPLVVNDPGYNVFTLVESAASAALDGTLRDNIDAIIQINKTKSHPTKIYRLAPLLDRNNSPSTFGFDGSYNNFQLQMSLYDWFMQGYLDALGYDDNSSVNNDAVYQDYINADPSRGYKKNAAITGNCWWYAWDKSSPQSGLGSN